jgi:hypothetical protein
MSKATRDLKKIGSALWSGVLYIWNRPVIMLIILVVAAYFLFTQILAQTFTQYTNCNYLIVSELGMDPLFCNGYVLRAMGVTVFTLPGLSSVMNPPLEFVRTILAWSVLFVFAFLSIFLTTIVNNIKSVVRLLTFNKEEWGRFLASARTWLFFFVLFCSVFYFTVIR